MTYAPSEMPRKETVQRLRALQSGERSARSARMSTVLRAFFPLPRDEKLESELVELIDGCILAHDEIAGGGGSGRIVEGRVLAIVGGPGAGKSRSLQRAFSKREEFAGYGVPDAGSLLVSVTAPSPGISKQVAKTLLAAMGYTTDRDLKENVAWEMVRWQSRLQGISFMHIDELHHVFQNPNPNEIQKVRDTLKSLLQQPNWPIWLILSGLPAVADFLEGDTQLRRRTRFVRFDPLSSKRDIKTVNRMINGFSERANLKPEKLIWDNKDEDTTNEFAGRLLHAAQGQAGMVIEFIQDAAKVAIDEGSSTLAVRHFGKAYRARTGCGPNGNVFMVFEGWDLIDVRRTLYPQEAEPAGEPKSKRGPLDERKRR